MALLNLTESEYIDRYGPTPLYTPEEDGYLENPTTWLRPIAVSVECNAVSN